MKKLILVLLAIVGTYSNYFAQQKDVHEQDGDRQFAVFDFDKSIKCYLESKQLTVQGQRNLATSYTLNDQYAEASNVYRTLVDTSAVLIPEDYLNYAMSLKRNGQEAESVKWLDRFQKAAPTDLRAISYVKNKDNYAAYVQGDGLITLIPQGINTKAQDFGTSYFGDKVVYASSNSGSKIFKRKYRYNHQPFLNVYVAELKSGQLVNPKLFDAAINTKLHDGPACFSNNGREMAFTGNNIHDEKSDQFAELQILFSSYVDHHWTTPVPFAFNDLNHSSGLPFLTSDGQTLYFVSDMPGGYGGTDLYKSVKNSNGVWSEPLNLGKEINTEGDEMFPFISESEQVLYFASNGHFGIGGLDIFSAELLGRGYGTVTNLGAPLNTKDDDYAYMINATNEGFFSSNRSGGKGSDDLYGFSWVPQGKTIVGISKDSANAIISGVLVELYNDKGTVLAAVRSDEKGNYSFPVAAGMNFVLSGNKSTYTEGRTHTDSYGETTVIVADVVLTPVQKAIVKVPKHNLTSLIKLKPIYFDFNQSVIRKDAAVELDKVVKLMNNHPDMLVELASHTDCRGAEVYNDSLSAHRAQETVAYIRKRISNPERITGFGYGERQLINGCSCEGDEVSTCTEWGHQRNRRTEFFVKEKQYE